MEQSQGKLYILQHKEEESSLRVDEKEKIKEGGGAYHNHQNPPFLNTRELDDSLTIQILKHFLIKNTVKLLLILTVVSFFKGRERDNPHP